jgi:ATPase family associated with various cellular activities (AAA)
MNQAWTRDTEPAAPLVEPWQERNATLMALGLQWIAARETGEGDSAAYHDMRLQMRKQGEAAAIDRLSDLLGLAPFDEDLLLIALSAQLTGTPKQVTVKTAQSLLGLADHDAALAEVWDRMSPHQPLRRYRLIETAERPVSATTPLFIDERIGRFMMGEDVADRQLSTLVSPCEVEPVPDRHVKPITALAQKLKSHAQGFAMILGPQHAGRRAAAQRLAGLFGLGLVELQARGLEAAPDLLPVLSRELVLTQNALLVDADEVEARRLLEGPLRQVNTLVLVIGTLRPELGFDMPQLRLEALDAADRVALWQTCLGPRSADRQDAIAAMAEQFRFGPRAIAAIAREGGDLWQACKERASRALEELADRIVPSQDWDNIVLPDDVLHDLKAAAAQVRHRSLVYGTHGFAQKYPRGRGISILLAGPSGVGKTMAAEVVAHDLALDLYRIDLSRIVSKYIGETEKNLKAVFDAAELSGAVLLFDEADALFGKRSEVNDSHDRYANIEVSYLLQRMEAYSGLAVLATNMKSHLDPAFLRRLRYVIDVPFPDADARALIWQKAFPSAMPRAVLDYDALARLEVPGGNIAVIAINAAFLAAADGMALSMAHIARAARAEFRKLDRELRVGWIGDTWT